VTIAILQANGQEIAIRPEDHIRNRNLEVNRENGQSMVEQQIPEVHHSVQISSDEQGAATRAPGSADNLCLLPEIHRRGCVLDLL